jgi:DNA polymerase I-like protein with 3'-5' exonuclease and polymerase domains
LIDYADAERWILAAEGRDIHEELARTMFQKDKKELTPSEAKLHRAASFGILYGRNYGPPKEEPR